MSKFQGQFNGIPFLANQLESLGKRIKGPICAEAVRQAMKVSYNAIKPRVGKAASRLGYRLKPFRRTGLFEGIVGINVGKQQYAAVRYLATVVTGTEQRFRSTRSGKSVSTGRIIGNNGVAIGMAVSASDAAVAMEASIKKSLSKLTK